MKDLLGYAFFRGQKKRLFRPRIEITILSLLYKKKNFKNLLLQKDFSAWGLGY
jgi:hypothetical protein